MELKEVLKQEYEACKSILSIKEKSKTKLFVDYDEKLRAECLSHSLQRILEDEELLEALDKTYSFGPVLAKLSVEEFQKEGIIQFRFWLNWKTIDEETKEKMNKYDSGDIVYELLHDYYNSFICCGTLPLKNNDDLEWSMCKKTTFYYELREMVKTLQEEKISTMLSRMFEDFVKNQLISLLELQKEAGETLGELRGWRRKNEK